LDKVGPIVGRLVEAEVPLVVVDDQGFAAAAEPARGRLALDAEI
jgi:hypothetical protein